MTAYDIKQRHTKFDLFTYQFHNDIVNFNINASLHPTSQDDFDNRVLNIVVLLCYNHFSEYFNAK